jgi:hypothetical protein
VGRVPTEGQPIDVRFTKWGGGRHWEFPLRWLGVDEHGVWGAGEVGTRLWRPGAGFESPIGWVTLFPHDRPWAASFYGSAHLQVDTYVDMTTVPEWSEASVSMVDLDLDVVLMRDGSLWVDDVDEFEEHRVRLGYPDEVVDLARRTADEVVAAIWDGTEPFGAAREAWLGHLGR